MVVSLELEKNGQIYFPGDVIKGKVVVTKDVENKLELLKIRFYGTITKKESLEDILPADLLKSCDTKNATPVFLDETVCLIYSFKQLEPGRHEFPFETRLPSKLPSSFEVSTAKLIYQFIVMMKRETLDSFKLYQFPFTVAQDPTKSTYNLRRDQPLWHEESEEREIPSVGIHTLSLQKNVNPWFQCCSQAAVFGFKIVIESKNNRNLNVFYPGDVLSFKLTAHNLTSVTIVKPIRVALIREFRHFNEESKTTLNTWEDHIDEIEAGENNYVWKDNSYTIPIDMPCSSDTHYRSVYVIKYHLKVTMEHPRAKLSGCLPIVIDCKMPENTENREEYETQMPSAPPPPTYEESALMHKN